MRAEAVLALLHHIESKRGNGAVTRNCRLAAIRSFAEHLLRHDVTQAEQYGRILAIPTKRAVSRLLTYLEPEDVRTVIAVADGDATASCRDRALLLLLYNTGARNSATLALRFRDLQLEKPKQVRLYGKGGKERMCRCGPRPPLRCELSSWTQATMFRSARNRPLTRDGAAYIIEKYVRRAAESLPALRRRRVTPHVLRHMYCTS